MENLLYQSLLYRGLTVLHIFLCEVWHHHHYSCTLGGRDLHEWCPWLESTECDIKSWLTIVMTGRPDYLLLAVSDWMWTANNLVKLSCTAWQCYLGRLHFVTCSKLLRVFHSYRLSLQPPWCIWSCWIGCFRACNTGVFFVFWFLSSLALQLRKLRELVSCL